MNEKEKEVVSKMITIYCRSKHKSGKELCHECEILKTYAMQRLERCPFGEGKPTCGTCTIHCYKKRYEREDKIGNAICRTPHDFYSSLYNSQTHDQRAQTKQRVFC